MDARSDVETLIDNLADVDERLRALYRALADDPDLAEKHDAEIRDLRAERHSLAERVGLAVLAQRRHASGELGEETADESDAGPRSKEDEDVVSDAPVSEPAVSTEAIDDWRRKASESGLGRATYEDRFPIAWTVTLDTLMTRVGAPRDLDVEIDDELDALDVVGREPLIASWPSLPRNVQQMWLGMLVARTRAVKSVSGLSAAQRARVKAVISRYPGWAADHQPGHVHGLRVDHGPIDGTWASDAQRLWGALKKLVDDERLAPRATPSRRKRVEREETDEVSEREIDPTWPLWASVRGRRALMVGGDPREPNRERLERAFGFASLDWPDIAGPRRVDAVVARIKRRTVDVVLVLAGFVDHKQSEPIVAAAKEAGVAWALADGYGTASVKSGLERFLGARSAS